MRITILLILVAILASCGSSIKVPLVDFQIEPVSEYDKSKGIIPVFSKNRWEYQVQYYNPLSEEPRDSELPTYFVYLGDPVVLDLELDSTKGKAEAFPVVFSKGGEANYFYVAFQDGILGLQKDSESYKLSSHLIYFNDTSKYDIRYNALFQGTETITTPAGDFRCHVVKRYTSISIDRSGMLNPAMIPEYDYFLIYLSPGIGIIRTERYSKMGNLKMRMDLKFYYISQLKK